MEKKFKLPYRVTEKVYSDGTSKFYVWQNMNLIATDLNSMEKAKKAIADYEAKPHVVNTIEHHL